LGILIFAAQRRVWFRCIGLRGQRLGLRLPQL